MKNAILIIFVLFFSVFTTHSVFCFEVENTSQTIYFQADTTIDTTDMCFGVYDKNPVEFASIINIEIPDFVQTLIDIYNLNGGTWIHVDIW